MMQMTCDPAIETREEAVAVKTRIVLPDGNGETLPGVSDLAVGDITDGKEHGGINGWTVYRIEVFCSTKHVYVH